MSKFKLRLTGISDDTGKPQTLEMEAYAKDADELAARLDKEFNLKLDENGWSMYIEWLSDDDSKMVDALDEWDKWTANSDALCGTSKPLHVPAEWEDWSRYMDKQMYEDELNREVQRRQQAIS